MFFQQSPPKKNKKNTPQVRGKCAHACYGQCVLKLHKHVLLLYAMYLYTYKHTKTDNIIIFELQDRCFRIS